RPNSAADVSGAANDSATSASTTTAVGTKTGARMEVRRPGGASPGGVGSGGIMASLRVDRWLPATPAERSHDGVKAGAPLPRPRPPGSLPPAHSCRPGLHATPADRRRERRGAPGPRAYTPRQGPAPGDRPWKPPARRERRLQRRKQAQGTDRTPGHGRDAHATAAPAPPPPTHAGPAMNPQVESFHDPATGTFSHLVYDHDG